MKRTRKWLLGIGSALAVLVLAVAVLLAWLLYTPSGLRFALDRGVAMLHGEFAYGTASGTLAGEATLTGLRYHDAEGDRLRVKTATLALQPWALLGRRLHLRKAYLDGITLDLAPAQAASTSSGFSLRPPLAIVLDDAHLTHITVSENGKPTFTADSLDLAGTWTRRRIVLRHLALRAPVGSANLDGTLAFARGYRGQGKATFAWTEDGTHYAGTATAQSNGKTATAHATLRAPAPLQLDATLKLDKRHAWTVALNAPTFNARDLPALPASVKTLALNLRGAGDGAGGKLTGTLAANGHVVAIDPAQFHYSNGTLTLDPLRLRSPSMPGTATATGVVHVGATPMTAALDVAWSGVQLPADLVGQKLDTDGKVHLDGSAERFALRGALALGPPGKPSNLQVDIAGTPDSIRLKSLKLAQKNGGLDAHGSIALQPHVAWQLDAVATRFDPGAILAGWNGALDFNLATTGRITPQGPEGTLKLDRANGTLRGRSIAGSTADLTITPTNWLAGSAVLVAGNSRVKIDGRPGKAIDATLALNVASLNDWLPGASGKLDGQFHVKGIWPRLAVTGRLNGTGLADAGRSVATLQLTAAVPDISKPGGNLDLALGGVHASGLDFQHVTLQGNGTAAAHHLALVATGKPLSVTANVQGSWQASAKKWTGSLSGIELALHGMPAWRQQQASALTWHNGAATLAQLCLSAGTPRLCLSGSRGANGAIKAQYTLQHLPLQMLAGLAGGAAPLQATGELSGAGQVSIAASGTLGGNAALQASAGHIAFAATAGQPLLAWTGITANATAAGNRQQVSLHGALAGGGHLDGNVNVTGASHALSGTVSADLRSLAFISALSTEVANVKGTLTGSLQLGGTLAAPQFAGRIQTHGFSAELPRAGLKLSDGEFAVTGDPQGHLAITGQVTSGKGVLHVTGSTGLAANAPLQLAIKGNDVLVADIPAAHVVASPDLTITRSAGAFALTGSVVIPGAKLEVEKLPGQGPTQASPDVVIVDAPPAPPVSPLALDADIEVKLGNAVKVQGYGLDGTVHGQLAVRVRPGHTATGRGQISVSGKYQAYGQDLSIENGRVLFAGTRLDDPGLDIRAVRRIRTQDVTVGLSIRGTAQHPVLTVFSDPTMEQAEALSYLVTGRALNDLKSGEGNTLNTAAQALGGLAGDRLAKSIGSRLGLEAGVSSSEALGGSAFTAGKYLSPRLFLSYGVGLFTPGQVITLRYTINRFLQFEAENATTGNRASLNYRIEKPD
ncbi:MAG TPA: translocation/assembly module TamB domain-containing protein [Rhodanobacteraceae bacterium]